MNLPEIKSWINDHLGGDVKVIEQAGRKRTNEYDGVLSEVFPAVFIIDLDEPDEPDHVSFTYTKILTQDIEVTFYED